MRRRCFTCRRAGRCRRRCGLPTGGCGGDGARTAYLVSGVSGADAALTATLSDGPVYLVPPCGPLPATVAAGLRRVRPQRIVAVGDDRALCPRLLQQAVASTTVRPDEAARDVGIADKQVCLLTRAGHVRCFGESPSGQVVRSPRPVVGLGGPVRSIIAGEQEVCAIDLADAVWCWGGSSVIGPAVRVAGLSGVVDYAPGQRVSCALRGSARLWCRSDGGFVEMRGLPSAVRFVDGAQGSCLREHAAGCLGRGGSRGCRCRGGRGELHDLVRGAERRECRLSRRSRGRELGCLGGRGARAEISGGRGAGVRAGGRDVDRPRFGG